MQYRIKTLLTTGLLLALTNTIQAQTYWLNVPGAYSKEEQQYIPAISLPTASHDACSDAIVQYAQDNLVHYIGCDVKPLPNAVNLPHGARRPEMSFHKSGK
ncbi:MAG: hypothetical protein PVG66_08295 [Chromatiales bacterium]|jgi:hypothetical protein